MTGVILVCRMSSSRLPGKTLMPFGQTTLLGHIVARIEAGGVARDRIVVCTSTDAGDAAILTAAADLGCNSFAGSLNNVSRRILDAAAAHGMERFTLILGDNAWIDPGQIRALHAAAATGRHDYIVTATPELAYRPEDEPYYPIGTRLQHIRRAYMEERLAELDDAVVQEHSSRLFAALPNGTRTGVIYTPDGHSKADTGMLNISINTGQDYEHALTALAAVGDPLAPTRAVTDIYLAG